MKRFLLIFALSLLVFVLAFGCVAWAMPTSESDIPRVMNNPPVTDLSDKNERPSSDDLDIEDEQPFKNQDPAEFPSPNPDIGYKPIKENESNKNTINKTNKLSDYLFIGIGGCAVILAIVAVLIVKAIKRKRHQW